MSRRILAVLLAVLVAAIVLFAIRDSSSEISVTQTLRTVDLVASVNSINVDSGWLPIKTYIEHELKINTKEE